MEHHSFELEADHYHTGQGSIRYKGKPCAPNQPPAIRDIYVERWALGARPPRKLLITVNWDADERDDEYDPGDV